MNDLILFGLSVVLSFLAWGAVCRRYVWPRIRTETLADAVRPLLHFHLFRFVGASFLISGVAGAGLPQAFATPAALGDLAAVALAWSALLSLRTAAAPAMLWLFNLWGTADLLFAFYHGVFDPDFHPASLGAAFYIPTVLVPLLLCTHVMIFALLLRSAKPATATGRAPSTPQ